MIDIGIILIIFGIFVLGIAVGMYCSLKEYDKFKKYLLKTYFNENIEN